MLAANYPTKAALKKSVGQELRYTETSMMGSEYPKDGNGSFPMVGPSAYERKWYAQVTVKDHKIVKVK